MKRGLEFLAFGGMALAAHAALALAVGVSAGGDGGAGQGNDDTTAMPAPRITLTDAVALASEWHQQPAAQAQVAALAPPPPPVMIPRQAVETPILSPNSVVLMPAPGGLALPGGDQSPPAAMIDTQPAQPQSAAAGLTQSPRPQARPPRPTARAEAAPIPAAPQMVAANAPPPVATASGARASQAQTSQGSATQIGAGARRSLIADWGAQIRARLDGRRPAVQGRGVATITLTIARDGRLASVALAQSSGNAALDRAALETARRVNRFPAAPAGLTDPRYVFALPIRFR